MSVPKCLTAMSQALLQTTGLVIQGREPDWASLEERLVTIIAAIHPHPKRKQPSRLAQAVSELLTASITPTAASP